MTSWPPLRSRQRASPTPLRRRTSLCHTPSSSHHAVPPARPPVRWEPRRHRPLPHRPLPGAAGTAAGPVPAGGAPAAAAEPAETPAAHESPRGAAGATPSAAAGPRPDTANAGKTVDTAAEDTGPAGWWRLLRRGLGQR